MGNDATSGGARPPRRREQLWSATFVVIIGVSFFLFVTGQGLNGGLAVYVERVGGTATFAGLLSAVFSVSAAVARLALGPVIDTRGRMIVAVCGTVVLVGGVALAGLVVNDVALTIARVIQGAGFAAATTAAATAAADVLPASRMGEGFGYFGLGQAVAMSFGPALALAVLSTDPPQNLFLLNAATTAVALALALSCRYERRPSVLPPDAVYRRRSEGRANTEVGTAAKPAPADAALDDQSAAADRSGIEHPNGTAAEGGSADAPRERGLRAFFEPRALPGAVPLLLMSTAVGFAISFAGLYGESLDVGNAGLFFSVSAISMVAVRLASKSFMDTALPISIFAVATAAGVIAFLMLLFAPGARALFYAAGLFYGVFLGLSVPVNQSVAVKNTPPERWGATNALVLLANDLSIGGSSLVWGALNDTLGFSASIIGAIACMAAALAVAWIIYPADAKFGKTRGK